MRSRRKILGGALLCSTSVVLILAGLIRWAPSRHEGLLDDFSDVPLENVLAFAERANSAYHEAETFRKEYGTEIEDGEFPGSGLRVYVDHNPSGKAQWVVLRGTANIQNIADDLEFIDRDEHELGINVHSGFNAALQECLPWILKRLDKERPVWVTGHSLGGAVAALLVATLDHRGFTDVSGITFGQPKFTDAHGVEKLAHLKLIRVVHDEDPIPMLPPLAPIGSGIGLYRHCGPEVIVSASGHFRFLPEHDAERMVVTEIWQNLVSIRPLFHDMVKGYLPALKGALALAPHHSLSRPKTSSPKPHTP